MIVFAATIIGSFIYCLGSLVSGSFLVLSTPEYNLSLVDDATLFFTSYLIGELDRYRNDP